MEPSSSAAWPAVLMAEGLLDSTAMMSPELSRVHTFQLMSRYYIGFADLLHLVFPSNLILTTDYSMYGMQMPLMPLLFVPLAFARRRLKAPFLICGAAAAVMCFAPPVRSPRCSFGSFPCSAFPVFQRAITGSSFTCPY